MARGSFLSLRRLVERGGADPFRLRAEPLGGPQNPRGEFVLYWIQGIRRLEGNGALEFAIGEANRARHPVVVFETARPDDPGASDRLHAFVLQGSSGNREAAARRGLSYLFHLPRSGKDADAALDAVAARASLIVTDDVPVRPLRARTEAFARRSPAPLIRFDGNGLMPMRAFPGEQYSARFFRDRAHRLLADCWSAVRPIDPAVQRPVDLGLEPWEGEDPVAAAATCAVDHGVPPVAARGGRAEALVVLDRFLEERLEGYAARRGREADRTSGLSPWIHEGWIGAEEIARRVLFSGAPAEDVEAFLEQLIIRRELSFNLCHFNAQHDSLAALPAWALRTLRSHEGDRRAPLYDDATLEEGETADPVWNLAQQQLRATGTMHNYLRMLWGKRVLEWTETPEDAHRFLVRMHERWALDGRDPNTHAGILWCFGKHDRPWAPERPVYGTIRYMSSEATRKKVDLRAIARTLGRDS